MTEFKEDPSIMQHIHDLIFKFRDLTNTPEEVESKEFYDRYLGFISEESTEYFESEDDLGKLDGICDQFFVTVIANESPHATEQEIMNNVDKMSNMIAIADRSGYDFIGAMLAVCLNNMSKVPLRSEVEDLYGRKYADRYLGEGMLKGPPTEWIDDQGVYPGTCMYNISLGNVDYVLFKDKNNKVAKWAGYTPVDLTPYIGKKED